MTRKENVDISDYPLLTFEESVKNNEVRLLKQFIVKGLVDDINVKIFHLFDYYYEHVLQYKPK